MKNLLTAVLPALALFALGGCAGTSAVASTEDDGVYYSSKDRTTAIVSASPAPQAAPEEAANPDYNGRTAGSAAPTTGSARTSAPSSGSDQYYDDSYTYMRGVPGYGLSSYAPYSPYTSLDYGYGNYGWGGAYGYSPYGYGFADPFYSPFYSPFGYGYGSGVSISFGYGYARPFGYGGYGYSRPYGYGRGFYDPYYYNGPMYGGYYGRSGYYGNSYSGYYSNGGYYGSRQTIRANGNNTRASNPVLVGPRGGRGGDVIARRSSAPAAPGSVPPPAAPNRGRRNMDNFSDQPDSPTGNPGVISSAPSSGRLERPQLDENRTYPAPNSPTAITDGQSTSRRGRFSGEEITRPRSYDAAPANSPGTAPNGGSRNLNERRAAGTDRVAEQPQTQPQPVERQSRRGSFFGEVSGGNPNNGNNRSADQPAQQPQQRVYEQPQRAYEQPQQRSPERPSYSRPSSSESNSGGSNSGGGGGNNGGGGGRRGGRY